MLKMRYWTCLFLLPIIFCNNRIQKVNGSAETVPVNYLTLTDGKNEICWIGALNGKIAVFIHYQLISNLIIGEITYLNTKDKLPIKLLGTIENHKSYRLLEFDNTGNITGIIEGKPGNRTFTGHWVSTKTKKELAMTLFQKDTVIGNSNYKPDETQIFGSYHYQFGEKGYNGEFDICKVEGDKIGFNILSLTNIERGSNVAEVPKDTITMKGDSFIYKIPRSDNCEFKVTFYKGFVYINYTKGYCENQFGLNATIDGIYLKTK